MVIRMGNGLASMLEAPPPGEQAAGWPAAITSDAQENVARNPIRRKVDGGTLCN
jgi:hypothetical protein